MTDKKVVNIFSASVFAALLIILLIPFGESGRIVAATLLLPTSILAHYFIKKRNMLSINKRHIFFIALAFALVYVMLYYLSGLRFGFYSNLYGLTATNFFKFLLPIAVIIFSTELFRFIIYAQPGKAARILCYFSCVFADILIVSTISNVTTFSRFMSVVAGAFFPAILNNLLFNYLSVRYGFYPNLTYRLITVLHSYIFPITSGISASLLNFVRLLAPIIVFLFIDSLYEKKRRYALRGNSRLLRAASALVTAVALVIMTGTVMLVSNQFRYGSLVIATGSMSGELEVGDVVIFESYDDQPIVKGQVIVFEKDDSTVVHRVVDIKIINGIAQYYTKGDANEHNDSGFITDSDIVGVVNHKLPLFGYPTLWLRSLFKR